MRHRPAQQAPGDAVAQGPQTGLRLKAIALRPGSPLAAGLLSFVWPGLGQAYLRRRNEAILFALPALAAAVWLIAHLSQGGANFIGSFFADAGFALTFALVVAFIGLWRGASMVHAYVLALRQHPRLLDVGVMAVLLLAILASHTWIVRTAWAAYVFDNDIGKNDFLSGLPTITADPSEEYVASPSPTATDQPWVPMSTVAAPEPSSAITPRPSGQRVTILLTGIDRLDTNSHSLMDSLLVASLDLKSRKVAMVSVPRDTSNYELYWGGKAGSKTKINNFYNLVRAKLIQAPDEPLTALKKQIGWLVGVRIDYYAVIDLHGFRVLVDMVGGVCVDNPRAINDPFTGTFIPKGEVCMDGITTLKYTRSRHGAGDTDYTRSARQQDVMYALSKKLVTPEGLLLLPDLLGLAGKSIQTDFPLRTVNKYIPIAQNLKSKDVSQCVLGPPYNYSPPYAETGGTYTSRLKTPRVAQLSLYLFGVDSRFYGLEGIVPEPCQRRN